MKVLKVLAKKIVYFMLLSYLIFLPASSARAEDEDSVLFISSYSESFITVPSQIEGLRSVFDEQNVLLDIEYMDSKRLTTKENIHNFYISLKYKLSNLPIYDAIIVGDDSALQFAIDYQQELFPELPIIFFGINDKERAKTAYDNPYMGGSTEETSLEENIKIAMLFNPDATKVIGIVDGTLTGQGDRKQFEEAVKSFDELEASVLNVSDYTFNEFGEILENIGEDTILLFQSMNQDIVGDYLDLDHQIEFLKEHTKVPVYRASVGGVGEGLMGGRMISYFDMGKNAAETVLEVLDGTPMDAIVLNKTTPYYYIFDYDLIQKYNIDEDRIPPEAILVNKVISPLEKYKNYILTVGGILFVLTIFSTILSFDNAKLRRMKKELQESHEELTATYEELSASEEELKTQYELVQARSEEVNALYQKYDIAIQGTKSTVWELDLNTIATTYLGNADNHLVKSTNQHIINDELIFSMINSDYWQQVQDEIDKCARGEIEEINIQVPTNSEEENQRWLLFRGKRMETSEKCTNKISGIFMDITNMKKQEDYINYMASYDFLTKLPNRMHFLDVLSSELYKGGTGAVMLMDIDNFKTINDTQGHVYGDCLLKAFAERLNSISEKNMFCARLGGDEFLILIKSVSEEAEINPYVSKIMATFDEPFHMDGIENFINISVGITSYPKDSTNINQLIMNADTAMYKVKHSGKNGYVYYHENMKQEIESKIEIEYMIRQALKEEGFQLYYQPQVDISSGNIIAFEALLRLSDYPVSPGIFIPIAEETGQIIGIGRWVAREAIRQIAQWREKGFKEKIVSINYSSKQLRDRGYIDYLKLLLQIYKVSAEHVEIEITENILLENDIQTLEFLQELKFAGFKIALDDFGTGYSSLNYLTYIPVDKIKLDKSINDKFLSHENTNVMDSLISLAHSLKLKITAEGIEETEKLKRLKIGGCDYIQGYIFSKPITAEAAEKIYDLNMLEQVIL